MAFEGERIDKAAWLIEFCTSGVVKAIMRERSISMVDAMELFFSSDVYSALCDRETGLYLESPSYLMELFELE